MFCYVSLQLLYKSYRQFYYSGFWLFLIESLGGILSQIALVFALLCISSVITINVNEINFHWSIHWWISDTVLDHSSSAMLCFLLLHIQMCYLNRRGNHFSSFLLVDGFWLLLEVLDEMLILRVSELIVHFRYNGTMYRIHISGTRTYMSRL